ncbi:MAG TPA: maltose alpha-D-glucosyltransferase [Pirellulales bacterium]|jgi:maltose alpha-D-glucosyltransferase/alpha-amylase|nr:maltose alpha-D-glucosyltransferase [Pirellulales bacterium]
MSDPLWYKDAVVYQLHVRSFRDSNGDGVGDFTGLTQKLDYIQDLGVTALWLLPFYPSPLKDDGYDIADYTDINPMYGTMAQCREFLREAHARGLKVITELVLNHTSDQHAWFQRSRRAKPGSRWRDFYVWSDTPDKYPDARVIFKDFEPSNWTWDPVAKAYYWHRFYAHQPDLNFDNPQVRQTLLGIIDHWMKIGIDGLRLDAIPYLYEREGTNCESLPETHAFLKELRRHIDERFADRMLLAEANQWPDETSAYFGNGDECQTAFHFPVMPRLFMALELEDRYPIVDILQQTPPIPDNCQWMMFLRNHDELTLEMVSDEERDYMWRIYARDRQARINLGIRRRLAPLLRNDRRKIELMNVLLFSLPGTPVVYYGDEIGMGDNIYLGDRHGVRTPMQWSADRNAGFSSANPQRLFLPPVIDYEYHYESINVETQRGNPQSLWWWMKHAIALRQQHAAFSRGTLDMLAPTNPKVLAFVRTYQDQSVLVIANLSRHSQFAEIDLSAYEGRRPVELFGHTKFPPLTRQPLHVTPGPHSYYWFLLRPQEEAAEVEGPGRARRPAIDVQQPEQWEESLAGRGRSRLEAGLRAALPWRRWFTDKSRTIQSASLVEVLPAGRDAQQRTVLLVLCRVDYTEGEPETYVLPLALAQGELAARIAREWPQLVVARAAIAGGEEGIVYDAIVDEAFSRSLLEAIVRRRRLSGEHGDFVCSSLTALRRMPLSSEPAPPRVVSGQSNSSVTFGDQLFLRLLRKAEPGVHPAVAMPRFLRSAGFDHVAQLLGELQYRHADDEPVTLGVVQGFVGNQGTAWQQATDMLRRQYERFLAEPAAREQIAALPCRAPLDLRGDAVPRVVQDLAGEFLPLAELLGRRTAEMHAALASDPTDSAFAAEPLTPNYLRSLYHSLRRLLAGSLQTLRSGLDALPPVAKADAERVLEHDRDLIGCLRRLIERRIDGMRLRCHGNYHLGQVLFTGSDYTIVGFEGDASRPLSERRIKRSPLLDVASMLRSYHIAASQAMLSVLETMALLPEDQRALEAAAQTWYHWVAAAFLRAYLGHGPNARCLPERVDDLRVLLHAFLLERALHELQFAAAQRPRWIDVALRGLLDVVETPAATRS